MFYEFLRIVFKTIFYVIFRTEVVGQENIPRDGRLILAANHMSNWDPPFLATFVPREVSYMAKQELFANPVFAAIIRSLHAFPVKRGAADRGAIKAAVAELKNEHCLGVFPEGTRSKDGKIHKAEAGVALLAALSQAPVLPAAIIGTNKIFSNGSLLPKLKVIYGKPMIFDGKANNKEELQNFSQNLMEEITLLVKIHSQDK